MDGNGRWARARGRPASVGHRAGVQSIKRALQACEDLGIEMLSVYAFSTENWTRPRPEVNALMRLFHETLRRELNEMIERGVRVVFSGRVSQLSPRIQRQIEEAMSLTSSCGRGVLNVCLNYGGRAEIADAARRLVEEGVEPADVDEQALRARLYVPWLPDPDLIIRTAGERRLSNFLLWQSAYAEVYVTDTLWPDFEARDLALAVQDYLGRIRRYGGRPASETVPG